MDVSILFLTWNRNQIANGVLKHNLLDHPPKANFELLVCDQGSKVPFYPIVEPSYFRQNKTNEGIARALNQLMLRAKGKHVFFMPNDVLMPPGWLDVLIEHAEQVPKAGLITVPGQDLIHPEEMVKGFNGKEYKIFRQPDISGQAGVHLFGPLLITRLAINEIGYYSEEYHPYGFEDSDLCMRAVIAGLYVFYVDYEPFKDLCPKAQEPKDYNDLKESWYFSNLSHHLWRARNYHKIGIYVPQPILKDEM